MLDTKRLVLEELRECDDFYQGDLLGWYCEGHVDINRFFDYAVIEYQEYRDEDEDEEKDVSENEDEDEGNDVFYPFSHSDVKHSWFRRPTEAELESGDYHPDQFIFSSQEQEGYNPITYIEF